MSKAATVPHTPGSTAVSPPPCPSTSPISKFDEGPRRCRGMQGHKGDHWAKVSDGRNIDPRFDDTLYWNDKDWTR